ncbi:MAG TPA: 4-hydroxy-2-oxovalerate aldolase [Oculatellaceae cyanobacterium]
MDVLETTLRDGSYAINFQFTANDTSVIASALEGAGFRLIEIGHGVGMNASATTKEVAIETDEAYLQAAAQVLSKAKFGMFCIPGIARLQDIDLAAEYGMGFIRIGTDVSKVPESEPFIARAKQHGMLVCANFMKSYACSPSEFAERARLSQKYGADVLYVVDSSGGMLPSDIEKYFRAVQATCDIPLAFHGHNNMGLAMANTVESVRLGATIVDSSLQGMGRSAGNASTEHTIATLNRMGIDLGIDLIEVLEIGEKYIRPLIRRRGLSSLDVIAGYAQFHSSYMSTIRKYASKYRVDPRKLIINLCEVDKVNAAAELVEKIARQLQSNEVEVFTARYDFDEYFGEEQSLQTQDQPVAVTAMNSLMRTQG